MAWGISPRFRATVPLGDFNAEHYLAIAAVAIETIGWRIAYSGSDGLIAFTGLSWASYAEQITVRIVKGNVKLKSECVGYQGLLTDYGKNEKNLDLLLREIEYQAFMYKDGVEELIQEHIANYTTKPQLSFQNRPLGVKEKVRKFKDLFFTQPGYTATPVLVCLNCAIYLIQNFFILIVFMGFTLVLKKNPQQLHDFMSTIRMIRGANNRELVQQGEFWRLLTSMFSHGSKLHLASNVIALTYIGSIIEPRLGKWRFSMLYILAGIAASTVSNFYRVQGDSIGASGAIFGLFGIFL